MSSRCGNDVGWVIAIALAVLVWGDVAPAGESPEKPPPTPILTSIRRQGWIQFTISSGRIVVTGSRGVNWSQAPRSGTADRGERLSIRITSSEPVMTYELKTPTYRFLLDVAAGRRLSMHRLPREGRPDAPIPVEFHEGPSGPLVLTVGAGDAQRVYRAESLWHLFLTEPAVARQHLAPLLRILGEWDFVKTSEEIEAILVQTAQSGAPPDQKLWAEWVRQLGDASFARREQADRELRGAGRVIATYLAQLDPARLDAEQRHRVRRILQAMSDMSNEESPPQLAAWLSGDATIWLALLSRPAEPTRRAAFKRLEAMVGEPLVFNPAADEPTRSRQIEALRTRIGGKQ